MNYHSLQLIFKNDLATTFYEKEKCILIYKTNKLFINKRNDLIRVYLEDVIRLIQDIPVKGEIVDLTGLRGNFKDIIEYLTNDYYPKMKNRGLVKCAYIVTDDLISNNLVEKIQIRNKTKTKTFQNIDQALKWVAAD